MTLLELPLMAKPNRKRAAPSERHVPAADTLPARSMPGGLLQFQLKRLIGEILVQGDHSPDMRASLLRHLAITPDRPELVLLAHLRDIQDPNDLPPYQVRVQTTDFEECSGVLGAPGLQAFQTLAKPALGRGPSPIEQLLQERKRDHD